MCQLQLGAHRHEAAAPHRCRSRIGRLPASDVKRIPCIGIPIRCRDMRMYCNPWMATQHLRALRHDRQHVIDFQPSEKHVQIGRTRRKPPLSASALGQSKPAEEQEDIARPDTVATQVALRGTCLPERWSPVHQVGDMPAAEVRIEVNMRLQAMLAGRQITQELIQCCIREIQIRQCSAVTSARNRQWKKATVRQDRAGHTAVLRIEAFAGKNDFHRRTSLEARNDAAWRFTTLHLEWFLSVPISVCRRFRGVANRHDNFDKLINFASPRLAIPPTPHPPYFPCGNKSDLLYLFISKS